VLAKFSRQRAHCTKARDINFPNVPLERQVKQFEGAGIAPRKPQEMCGSDCFAMQCNVMSCVCTYVRTCPHTRNRVAQEKKKGRDEPSPLSPNKLHSMAVGRKVNLSGLASDHQIQLKCSLLFSKWAVACDHPSVSRQRRAARSVPVRSKSPD
jgi:hypothetical protein